RYAENQIDRLAELADDLVRHQVAAIFTFAGGVFAAKAATTTIPIVFETAGDPVQLGLVTSLARPGGHLTGVTALNAEVDAKMLDLLHELVPSATTIGLLVNPNAPNVAEPTTRILQGGGPYPRARNTCLACQRRSRFRYGLCDAGSTASRCAGDRPQPILLY